MQEHPSFNSITNQRHIQGTAKQAQIWELNLKGACEYRLLH